MSRPSKRTPSKIGRVREARAGGEGLRAAAAKAGVSHETIRRWEKRELEKKPVAASGGAAVEAAALLAASPVSALEDVKQRLDVVRGVLARLTPAVEQDTYPATSYVTLSKYADELARLIVELTPPVPKDPAEDINVRDAERILVSRIEGMVAEAERARAGGAAR